LVPDFFIFVPMIIEACVENIGQAILADEKGAHRIELCRDLQSGGLTPSMELIQEVASHLKIPIKIMIRCRPGNFVYNDSELLIMLDSIEKLSALGFKDFVIGFLNEESNLDHPKLESVCNAFSFANFTFHKAIDVCQDPLKSIEELKKYSQIKSILTSGLAPTAMDGLPILKKMLVACGAELEMIAAGKITKNNLPALHQQLNAESYHGRKIVF